LERHVEHLLLDAKGLGREPQRLQGPDCDADLVGGLADRVRRRDRAVDQRGEAADGGDAKGRAAEGPNTGAQQLRLAATVARFRLPAGWRTQIGRFAELGSAVVYLLIAVVTVLRFIGASG
jgi:hypothetical protein